MQWYVTWTAIFYEKKRGKYGKDLKKEECKYCKKVNAAPLIDEFLAQARIVFVQDVTTNKLMPLLDVNNSFCKISFCPICSRNLKEEKA